VQGDFSIFSGCTEHFFVDNINQANFLRKNYAKKIGGLQNYSYLCVKITQDMNKERILMNIRDKEIKR